MLLELRLEALEERKRIGGAAGEAGENPVMVQAPHLLRATFDDHIAEGHLTVAAQRHRVPAAHGKDGRAMELFHRG